MKYILILLLITFASCTNKKAEIVEQIKKAQMDVTRAKIEKLEIMHEYRKTIDYNKPIPHFPHDKFNEAEEHLRHSKYVVDSLEMELKKY